MRTPRFEDENGGLAFERPAHQIDLPSAAAEADRARLLPGDPLRPTLTDELLERSDQPVERPVLTGDVPAVADRALSNPTRDPLDAYFRQISTGDLITREEEIALAKRIEAAQFALVDRLCRIPSIIERVGAWGVDLREGRLRLGALLEGAPPEPCLLYTSPSPRDRS